MSPLTRFLLTLAGVLLAGVPLVYLTSPRGNEQATLPLSQQPEPTLRTHLSLRYTGVPISATLRYEDDIIAEIAPAPASPYECFIDLPANCQIADIEVEIHWPENSPENAVTLTAEPQGRPSRTETQWTGSNGSLLHSIFTLSW